MKGALFVILTLAVAGFYIYKLPPQSLCDSPVGYKLGIVDTKFKLSESEVLAAIKDATELWSNEYQKPIFFFDPNAELTIDFVYDERAALNTQIAAKKSNLDEKNSVLKENISGYERDLSLFQSKLSAYNKLIEEKNSQGGVSMETYIELNNQRKALESESDALNARATDLNLATHNFNSQVQNLNNDVSEFNDQIALKPEEGVYDYSKNNITIFFANDKSELIHTLAHEFGHVLGINHVDNPEAIMYSYSSPSKKLTSPDIAGLNQVCAKLPVSQIWSKHVMQIWLRTADAIDNQF